MWSKQSNTVYMYMYKLILHVHVRVTNSPPWISKLKQANMYIIAIQLTGVPEAYKIL